MTGELLAWAPVDESGRTGPRTWDSVTGVDGTMVMDGTGLGGWTVVEEGCTGFSSIWFEGGSAVVKSANSLVTLITLKGAAGASSTSNSSAGNITGACIGVGAGRDCGAGAANAACSA